jgi:hypothetical protein
VTGAEPPAPESTWPVAPLVLTVVVIAGPAVDIYVHLDLVSS